MTRQDAISSDVASPLAHPSHHREDVWGIKVLFDGDCPLCAREIRFLERRDRGRGRIAFEDIAAPGFDPARYGLSQDQAMARIRGVLPDGSVVEGVEVFRRAYAAIGLGWLLAPTRWPGLRRLVDVCYRIFARNRLRWTGRAPACEAGTCDVSRRRPGLDASLDSASNRSAS